MCVTNQTEKYLNTSWNVVQNLRELSDVVCHRPSNNGIPRYITRDDWGEPESLLFQKIKDDLITLRNFDSTPPHCGVVRDWLNEVIQSGAKIQELEKNKPWSRIAFENDCLLSDLASHCENTWGLFDDAWNEVSKTETAWQPLEVTDDLKQIEIHVPHSENSIRFALNLDNDLLEELNKQPENERICQLLLSLVDSIEIMADLIEIRFLPLLKIGDLPTDEDCVDKEIDIVSMINELNNGNHPWHFAIASFKAHFKNFYFCASACKLELKKIPKNVSSLLSNKYKEVKIIALLNKIRESLSFRSVDIVNNISAQSFYSIMLTCFKLSDDLTSPDAITLRNRAKELENFHDELEAAYEVAVPCEMNTSVSNENDTSWDNFPPFESDSGKWVSNKAAAKIESPSIESLKQYRSNGPKSPDGMKGIDKDGRKWTKVGTPGAHPWYLRSSLCNVEKKLP